MKLIDVPILDYEIENILNHNESTSDDLSEDNQGDVMEDATNIVDDIPHNEEEKSEDADYEKLNEKELCGK